MLLVLAYLRFTNATVSVWKAMTFTGIVYCEVPNKGSAWWCDTKQSVKRFI